MAELHGGTEALGHADVSSAPRLRLKENEEQKGRGARLQRSRGQGEAVKRLR